MYTAGQAGWLLAVTENLVSCGCLFLVNVSEHQFFVNNDKLLLLLLYMFLLLFDDFT